MSQRSVVILSGVRTAIGDYGGSLKDIAPTDLGARAVREAIARAKVDPADVGQCVIGNVIHTEAKDMYISRLACVNGGLPHDTGALTLNRLCGSGLQAIVSASQAVLLGDPDVTLARGGETFEAILFRHADPLPERVHAVFRPEVNQWQGAESLELVIEHWAPDP